VTNELEKMQREQADESEILAISWWLNGIGKPQKALT
jgi:hypothetical protein